MEFFIFASFGCSIFAIGAFVFAALNPEDKDH
jgi:hypothetical protein